MINVLTQIKTMLYLGCNANETQTGDEKMNKLMEKYRKLEAAAERIAQSPYAGSEDKKQAWEAANKVWEKIKSQKKKK